MKLQNKFLTLLLPVGIAAAVLILFLVHKSVHAVILSELQKSISISATAYAQDAIPAFQTKNEAKLLPLLQSLQKQQGAIYVAALDAQGFVLSHTSITEKGKTDHDPLIGRIFQSDHPIVRRFTAHDEPIMEISIPVWSSLKTGSAESFLLSGELRTSKRDPLGVLKVAVSLQPSLAVENRIVRHTFLIVAAIGGLAFGFISLLVRGILRPIYALMTGIAGVSQGRYDVNVPIFSKDELGNLAHSFNLMSAKLAHTTVSKEYVEGILENMIDLLVVTDPEGKIETMNHAMLEALSYSAQEMLGRPIFVLFPEEENSFREQEFKTRLIAGAIRDLEVKIKTKSGRMIPALFSASVLKDRDGQLQGYIGVAKDIAERKRAEEALLAAKAATEIANKELEAFSYSVAHDLRAPLRAIDGFSQALLDDYSDKFDEQGKDFLHRLRSGSQRMGQLINDLLGLSRVTRSAMRREKFDMSALALDIATQLKTSQPERDVEFIIVKGLVANGDRSLLQAALENLLGNSWKYTKHRPQARVEFGQTITQGKKAYFVRDNGAGFDMAFAKKLFKPFSRLHSSAQFEGTGIGLATVQRIIERHGGEIWGESQVEKGSTFYFTLGENT